MMQCHCSPVCARALDSVLPLEIFYTDTAATKDVTKPEAIFRAAATVDSWNHIKVSSTRPSQTYQWKDTLTRIRSAWGCFLVPICLLQYVFGPGISVVFVVIRMVSGNYLVREELGPWDPVLRRREKHWHWVEDSSDFLLFVEGVAYIVDIRHDGCLDAGWCSSRFGAKAKALKNEKAGIPQAYCQWHYLVHQFGRTNSSPPFSIFGKV